MGAADLLDIGQALDMGVSRAILGTVALRQPEVVEQAIRQFGADRIMIAIDARHRLVAVQAWQEVTDLQDLEFGRRMRDLKVTRCVYTDVARDGTGSGPNVQATGELATQTGLKVIASGGIATTDHIESLLELEPLGVEGLIIGRALYTGDLKLSHVLRLVGCGTRTDNGGEDRC